MTFPQFLKISNTTLIPRKFAEAMREYGVSEKRILHEINQYEIFSLDIDGADSSILGICQYHGNWLLKLGREIGLDLSVKSTKDLSYLVFGNVGLHQDNATHEEFGEFAGERRYFLNVHLAGSGVFVAGEEEFSIGPGDVYIFNQGLEHGWRQISKGRSRAFGMSIPESIWQQK